MASAGEIGRRPAVHELRAGERLASDQGRRRGNGELKPNAVSKGLEVAALAALDKLSRGVLLLDTGGAVTFANRAARAMVAKADGLALRHQRLEFKTAAAQEAFERFLAGPSGPDTNSLVLCTGDHSSDRPYRVLVSPLYEGAGYCVFVYEPSGGHRPIPAGVLCRLYRLTHAEANLANELFAGLALAPAARARGISINTAKSTLKSIFSKCGVRNRAELILLLSLGPRTL